MQTLLIYLNLCPNKNHDQLSRKLRFSTNYKLLSLVYILVLEDK